MIQVSVLVDKFHKCIGLNKLENDGSDFQEQQFTEQCHRGHRVTYLTRKRTRECLIKEEYDPKIIEPCPCDTTSYRCAENFVVGDDDSCVQVQPDNNF